MDTVRAFIAIKLTPAILKRLGDLQARIKEDIPPRLVRWVKPQGIHLTLKFLGDVPASQIETIAEATRGACAPYASFSFTIGRLSCFPNPRRPRVVWVGVDEPRGALVRLQRAIEGALTPLGYPPERRPFHPHLTLGRVKGGSRDALQALGEYVSRAQVKVGTMEATSVSLMRSELLSGGAVYTELATAPLPD
jgi:2'-5' RNA ligase